MAYVSLIRLTGTRDGLPTTSSCRLLRYGWAVLLVDLLAFSGEWPIAIKRLRLLADGLRDAIDLEVFEDVDAELAGGREVDVAIVVEISCDDLCPNAGCSID